MVEIDRGHHVQANALQQLEALLEWAQVANVAIGVNHAAGLLAKRDRRGRERPLGGRLLRGAQQRTMAKVHTIECADTDRRSACLSNAAGK